MLRHEALVLGQYHLQPSLEQEVKSPFQILEKSSRFETLRCATRINAEILQA